MVTKEFLQNRVQKIFYDYFKEELFPTHAKIIVPKRTSAGSNAYNITIMSQKVTKEDRQRFAIESSTTATVLISIDDLDNLTPVSVNNPIPNKKLKEYESGIEFEFNTKRWYIREEEDSVMFDKFHKLILDIKS